MTWRSASLSHKVRQPASNEKTHIVPELYLGKPVIQRTSDVCGKLPLLAHRAEERDDNERALLEGQALPRPDRPPSLVQSIRRISQ